MLCLFFFIFFYAITGYPWGFDMSSGAVFELVCVRFFQIFIYYTDLNIFGRDMPCVAVLWIFYVVFDLVCGVLCLVLHGVAVGCWFVNLTLFSNLY